MYYDLSGDIFNSLYKFLQESQPHFLHDKCDSSFLYLKNFGTTSRIPPKYKTITHNRMTKGHNILLLA